MSSKRGVERSSEGGRDVKLRKEGTSEKSMVPRRSVRGRVAGGARAAGITAAKGMVVQLLDQVHRLRVVQLLDQVRRLWVHDQGCQLLEPVPAE